MGRERSGGNSKAIERAVTDPGDPWDRKPAESHQAYEAFIAYRDMEKPRSLRRAARQQDYSDHTQLGEWSRVHGWQERCAAWDAEQDRVRRAEHLREVEAMSRRQAQQAAAQQIALMEVPTRLLERIQQARAEGRDLFEDWDDRELVRALGETARAYSTAAQFERLARGLSTTNVAVEGSVTIDDARERVSKMSRAERLEYLGVSDSDQRALQELGLEPGELDRPEDLEGTATEIQPGEAA